MVPYRYSRVSWGRKRGQGRVARLHEDFVSTLGVCSHLPLPASMWGPKDPSLSDALGQWGSTPSPDHLHLSAHVSCLHLLPGPVWPASLLPRVLFSHALLPVVLLRKGEQQGSGDCVWTSCWGFTA